MRAEDGDAVAKTLLADPDSEELVKQRERGGMLPDQVYVAPREILAELKQQYPETLTGRRIADRADAEADGEARQPEQRRGRAPASRQRSCRAATPSRI